MKCKNKKPNSAKLSITAEAIRNLTTTDLGRVAGGGTARCNTQPVTQQAACPTNNTCPSVGPTCATC